MRISKIIPKGHKSDTLSDQSDMLNGCRTANWVKSVFVYLKNRKVARFQMLFRPTQKLASKIKVGKLVESSLDQNRFVDWSANLFVVNRRQHVLLCNTYTLFCSLIPAKGITSETKFAEAAIRGIESFFSEEGLAKAFSEVVLPHCSKVRFRKSLNRSVTGSMTDFIHAAKIYLEMTGDLHEASRKLNVTPMSALRDKDGRKSE